MNILIWTLSHFFFFFKLLSFIFLPLMNKNAADIVHSYIVGFAGAGSLKSVTAWHDWILVTWGLAERGEYVIPDFPIQDEYGRNLEPSTKKFGKKRPKTFAFINLHTLTSFPQLCLVVSQVCSLPFAPFHFSLHSRLKLS